MDKHSSLLLRCGIYKKPFRTLDLRFNGASTISFSLKSQLSPIINVALLYQITLFTKENFLKELSENNILIFLTQDF
jgi:hypothetical protein